MNDGVMMLPNWVKDGIVMHTSHPSADLEHAEKAKMNLNLDVLSGCLKYKIPITHDEFIPFFRGVL